MHFTLFPTSRTKRFILTLGVLFTLFSCDPLQMIDLRNESAYALCFDDIGSNCPPLINEYAGDTMALALRLAPAEDTTLFFEMGGWTKEDAQAVKNCLIAASPRNCVTGESIALDVEVKREGFGSSLMVITVKDK